MMTWRVIMRGAMGRFLLFSAFLICIALGGANSTVYAAAQSPDAAIGALMEMRGRFVIGPWIGSLQDGTCHLGNDEPLAGAGLFISARQKSSSYSVLVGGRPVQTDVAALAQDDRIFSLEGRTYDGHGFMRAFALFQDCVAGKIADDLPDEPLQESEPIPLLDAHGKDTGWQVVDLTMNDGYRYARLAILPLDNPVSLSLWLYAGKNAIMSVSSLGGTIWGDGEEVRLVPQRLDGSPAGEMILTLWPQEGGFLVPLTEDAINAIGQSTSLRIAAGKIDETYPVGDFAAVLEALGMR